MYYKDLKELREVVINQLVYIVNKLLFESIVSRELKLKNITPKLNKKGSQLLLASN